jgi:hypothetical protein
MKESVKKIFQFISRNWFKITILILIFWFISIIQDGIEVNHRGYIENKSPNYFDLDLGLPL